jgi:hypothetical protein
MKITVRPLTLDLWPALGHLFTPQGPVSRCWYMYWRLGDDYRKRPPSKNKGQVLTALPSSRP